MSESGIEIMLQDQALREIRQTARLAHSYLRSLKEAARRGDVGPTTVALEQVGLCVVAMVETYREAFERGYGEEAQAEAIGVAGPLGGTEGPGVR